MDEVVNQLIRTAISEDLGKGDVTAEYFIPEGRMARGFVTVREEGVVSGVAVAAEAFRQFHPDLTVNPMVDDGDRVAPGALVLEVNGPARAIVGAERTALNFLQHLSGIATLTARYVEKIHGTGAEILDTRKTTPGWRRLEKRAVADGGGTNHRMGLHDRAMVKDNHLAAEGGIAALQDAIHRLKRERPDVEVEIEADTLDQVRAFLSLEGVDHILLDNMSLDELRRAVEMRGQGGPMLEASGGVTLKSVHAIANTGVDFISVGALTHSAPALDIGMDFADPETEMP
jgi:nicotinate-nucleotide pyrophosphorylase (carboxylating)